MPHFIVGRTEAQRVGDVAQVMKPASWQRLDWNPCWFYFQSNVLYTVLPKQSHNFACYMSMGEKFTLNGCYWPFCLSLWSFAFLTKVMGTLCGLFPPRSFGGVLVLLMHVGSQAWHWWWEGRMWRVSEKKNAKCDFEKHWKANKQQ